jgi:hypothetical protein
MKKLVYVLAILAAASTAAMAKDLKQDNKATFFGICREKQRGIANGGRVGADFHFALVGLKEGVWRQGPAARLPALRLRTVRKESGNAFWCRPSTAAIAAGQTIQRE